MTAEQIGLYQAVLDTLVVDLADSESLGEKKKGAILAAITALKQICNHPAAYRDDGRPLAGRSGKLDRLEEIVESVFAAEERILVFTHFATLGPATCRPPHGGHRRSGGVLRREPRPWHPRPHDRRVPGRAPARVRSCCR